MPWDTVEMCTAGSRFYLHYRPSAFARYSLGRGYSPMPGMTPDKTLCGRNAEVWCFWIDAKKMKPCVECREKVVELKARAAKEWVRDHDEDGNPIHRLIPTQGDIRAMMRERLAKRERKPWQPAAKERSARLRTQADKARAHTRARQDRSFL